MSCDDGSGGDCTGWPVRSFVRAEFLEYLRMESKKCMLD